MEKDGVKKRQSFRSRPLLEKRRDDLQVRIERIFDIEPPLSYRDISAKIGIGPHVFSGFYRRYRMTEECKLRQIEKYIVEQERRLGLDKEESK